MYINARKYMAVWYHCPGCGERYGATKRTPRPKRRIQAGLCFWCGTLEQIEEVRYYTVYESDFYGDLGTYDQACKYVVKDHRQYRKLRRAYEERSRKAMQG